jgi:exodeoxyribonuclease V gamma subunit
MQRQVQLYRNELACLQPMKTPAIQLAAIAVAQGQQIVLSDTLDLVFHIKDEPSQVRRLMWLPSDLRVGSKFNFSQAVRLWPHHLALCTIAGECANTIIIHGGGRSVAWPGMPAVEAEQLLRRLLQAFDRGMQAPLPVACQTAFVAMVDHDAKIPSQSGRAEFQYNGGEHLIGDTAKSPLLARCWPTFEDLVRTPAATSAQPSFDQCVECLYRPFYKFLCEHFESLDQENHDD